MAEVAQNERIIFFVEEEIFIGSGLKVQEIRPPVL